MRANRALTSYDASGWGRKNLHSSSLAEIENVVLPTTLAIAFENWLPGHACPPPEIRYRATAPGGYPQTPPYAWWIWHDEPR